jgi:hypothetical protein
MNQLEEGLSSFYFLFFKDDKGLVRHYSIFTKKSKKMSVELSRKETTNLVYDICVVMEKLISILRSLQDVAHQFSRMERTLVRLLNL